MSGKRTTGWVMAALVAGGAALAEAPPVMHLPFPPDDAAAQISVEVTPGLRSNARVPTEALRTARKAMQDGQDISEADLRALADLGDGLAAQRLTRLMNAGTVSATDSDQAHYAGIAVGTGRVSMLPTMTEALLRLDPVTEPPERVAGYASVIYAYAWAGNPLAMDALIALNGDGRLFGALSDATRTRIEEAGDSAGDGRIFLTLALRELQPGGDEGRASGYLTRAAQGSNMMVRLAAETLLNNRGIAATTPVAADDGAQAP
jgi:hypothetical protein